MQHLIERLKRAHQVTRYCLIGSGIVCGLEASMDENYYVCVNSGTGLTSDGTYVEVPAPLEFIFYRPYTPIISDYPLFEYDTWELLSREAFQEGDTTLKPQNASQRKNPFLKDKVLILWLEKEQEETEEEPPIIELRNANSPDIGAAETNADNEDIGHGSHATADEESAKLLTKLFPSHKVKFLLIRQTDLLKVLNLDQLTTRMMWNRLEDDEDGIYSDEHFREQPNRTDLNKAVNPALRLAKIPLQRFGFAPGNPFVCPPEGNDFCGFPKIGCLKDIYDGNEKSEEDKMNDGTSGYVQVIEEAIGQLNRELDKLTLFAPLLGKKNGWDLQHTLDILKDKWNAFKAMNQSETKAEHKTYYVQYFYDWVRDLLKAYHELRWELIHLMAECCPDTNAFPCHLLLGMPIKGNVLQTAQPLRHTFQQPPIYNGNAARLEKIKQYFWRLMTMIKGFYLPGYIPEEFLKSCNTGIGEEAPDLNFDIIKVTPSKGYHHPLEAQTIPYYYPVYEYADSVHHYWNYHQSKYSSTDHLLSYHANAAEDTYTELPQVVHPLHYNLEEFDFYRIEGHIGHPIVKEISIKIDNQEILIEGGVEGYLNYIIEKYNLDFEIHKIRLSCNNSSTITIEGQYPMGDEESYNFWPRNRHLLGMEHLAGVKKGGTFILLYQDLNGKEVVVADFSLPYKISCCVGGGEAVNLGTIENAIETNTSNISELETKIGDCEAKLETLQDQLTEIEKSIDVLKTHDHDSDTGGGSTNPGRIKDLEDKVIAVEGRFDRALEDRINALRDSLRGEIDIIRTKPVVDPVAFEERIRVLTAEVSTIKTDIDGRLITLEGNIGNFTDRASLLDRVGVASATEANLAGSSIAGLGNATVVKLQKAGIFTVAQLAKLQPSDALLINKITGSSIGNEAKLNGWINAAKGMIGNT